MLLRGASTRDLPLTLIAINRDRLLGSVNIVNCDMDIRSELKPWLAQLYVDPPERGRGISYLFVFHLLVKFALLAAFIFLRKRALHLPFTECPGNRPADSAVIGIGWTFESRVLVSSAFHILPTFCLQRIFFLLEGEIEANCRPFALGAFRLDKAAVLFHYFSGYGEAEARPMNLFCGEKGLEDERQFLLWYPRSVIRHLQKNVRHIVDSLDPPRLSTHRPSALHLSHW